MFQDIELNTLIIVIGGAIIGHVALLVLSRYVNPLSVLCALFFPLAAFSAADDIPGSALFKFGRLYVGVLAILVGVFFLRAFRVGWASGAMLFFGLVFTLAGAYAESPMDAIQFKALFFIVLLSGAVLVGSFHTPNDVRIFTRLAAIGSSIFVVTIGVYVALSPSILFNLDRLILLGMNANRIGLEVACSFVLSLYVALYPNPRLLRVYCAVIAALSAAIVMATGSRGALGIIVVGGALIAAPTVRRPLLLGTSLIAGYLVSSVVLDAINPHAAKRLGEVNFDTRQGIWEEAITQWLQSPIIGLGWASRYTPGGRMTQVNYHSIFYQTLVEIGILGLILLFLVLLIAGITIAVTFVRTRQLDRDDRALTYFAAAMAITPVLHGIVENAAVQGSSSVPMCLAIGFALIDRMRHLGAARWDDGVNLDAQPQFDYGEPTAEATDDPQLTSA